MPNVPENPKMWLTAQRPSRILVKQNKGNFVREMDEPVPENKFITIKDVARHAGVAVSTVSRTLNGLDRVSQSTRDKVMDAVRDLGYTKNNLAVSMITRRTNVILVMVPDFINSFFSSIIQGAESYIRKVGYIAMVCAIGNERRVDFASIIRKYSGMFDGILLIPTTTDLDSVRMLEKPVVIVDRYLADSGLPSVTVDNVGGTYKLTKMLLEANHRRIAVLCDESPLNIGEGRLQGYHAAMKEYGVEPVKDLICRGGLFEDFGYKSTVQLMHRPNRPTAIVACGNLLCTGAILALNDMGIKIGEDISLVGFDENILASTLKPGVTVVSGFPVELGSRAAKMLINRIDTPDLPIEEIVMDVQVFERESIARLT